MIKSQNISIFLIIYFLLSPNLHACKNEPKPQLIIKLDKLWSEDAEFCADYQLIFPTEYNTEIYTHATIEHGRGKDKIQLMLLSHKNYKDTDAEKLTFDGTSSVYICSNSEWFNKLKLTLHYKYQSEGGWVMACHPSYHYENLTRLIQQ